MQTFRAGRKQNLPLESVQLVIEEFRIDYNQERPQKGRNKLLGRANFQTGRIQMVGHRKKF